MNTPKPHIQAMYGCLIVSAHNVPDPTVPTVVLKKDPATGEPIPITDGYATVVATLTGQGTAGTVLGTFTFRGIAISAAKQWFSEQPEQFRTAFVNWTQRAPSKFNAPFEYSGPATMVPSVASEQTSPSSESEAAPQVTPEQST